MRITACLLAVLAIFPLPAAVAQQSSEELLRRADESLAYARLIASHKLPDVTSSQCERAETTWLEANPLLSDRNNFDKLRFVRARSLRAKRDSILAERQYSYLRHHPIFKTEAEEFCDKSRKN